LVPGEVLTDASIVVLRGDCMHILSDSTNTNQEISRIVAVDNLNRSPFHITRMNGLYPLTKEQLIRLSRLRGEDSLSVANKTTYFHTELGRLGDLVRYFHEAWNHASKTQMLLIVDNQLFIDIPPELTRETILKYFDDYCYGCKLATIRETTKPQLSSTVYTVGELCVLDAHMWEKSDFSGNPPSISIREAPRNVRGRHFRSFPATYPAKGWDLLRHRLLFQISSNAHSHPDYCSRYAGY
jgi:hypothetical protein